jgi:hypothetical protein
LLDRYSTTWATLSAFPFFFIYLFFWWYRGLNWGLHSY